MQSRFRAPRRSPRGLATAAATGALCLGASGAVASSSQFSIAKTQSAPRVVANATCWTSGDCVLSLECGAVAHGNRRVRFKTDNRNVPAGGSTKLVCNPKNKKHRKRINQHLKTKPKLSIAYRYKDDRGYKVARVSMVK